ncbi:MAG: hypothetical protein ACJ8FY_22105, partial [Gemmataceae bacterium]
PRREPVLAIHAAAHIESGSPPQPDVNYQIDFSTDEGKTWQPVVKDWSIPRRGDEPKGFWSQSLCWGSNEPADKRSVRALVRFYNSGGKNYARCEAHLVYRVAGKDVTNVTFNWKDNAGAHQEAHSFAGVQPEPWDLPTSKNVQTNWVEFEPVK